MMMLLLISNSPCNDIDVYLEPLIDDLQVLFEMRVETYDVHVEKMFTLHIVVLWTINDYPTLGVLCGCTYSGYKDCIVCPKKY